MSFFSLKHYNAILFRRWIIFKRTWCSLLMAFVVALLISIINVIIQYLMVSINSIDRPPISFSDLQKLPDQLVFVNSSQSDVLELYSNILTDIFYNDTHKNISNLYVSSVDDLNALSYEYSQNKKNNFQYGASIDIQKGKSGSPGYFLSLFYNNSYRFQTESILVEVISTNALWKMAFGDSAGFEFSQSTVFFHMVEYFIPKGRSVLICCGFAFFIPYLVTQPINDLCGDAMSYMSSCGLKSFSYWSASFTIDMLLWAVMSSLNWCLFVALNIPGFISSGYYVYFAMLMSGPGNILFLYCMTFFFSSQTSASRHVFIVNIGSVLAQNVIELFTKHDDPWYWEECITAFFPPVSLFRSIFISTSPKLARTPFFPTFPTNDRFFPHFIGFFGSIILYSSILMVIEKSRFSYKSKLEKENFKKYKRQFIERKNKAAMANEARKMEEYIEKSEEITDNFAVKVKRACKLYFDNDKKPVFAVNLVSLGVCKNTLFGFLGANGAGKTTLIKMITGMIPVSGGTIEINGQDISNKNLKSYVNVCPQFNDHLIPEMTPMEHFTLFSLIYELEKSESSRKIRQIINLLDIESVLNTKVNEMSIGDVRKLAIALTFLSPATVILLDEPTTALDSNSRHLVHKLILEKKESNTILLCTHLLNEAELLCDQISIMVNGFIYTVDTPQNLTHKFGTGLKVDVLLNANDPNSEEKCTNFFQRKLPNAVEAINRQMTRIYRISSKEIGFSQLFQILEDGKKEDNGFVYYTCSSSSLEQTFLEIVKLTETGDTEAANSLLQTL